MTMTHSWTGGLSKASVGALALLLLLLLACGSSGEDTGDADVDSGDAHVDATSADAAPGDASVDADPPSDASADADPPPDAGTADAEADAAATECPAGYLCGTVSYSGAYTGPAAQIQVRVYREAGSASLNASAAVGAPDLFASRTGAGHYEVDLEGYEGTLFVSAFMDVDGSGFPGGPTAQATATNGVFSDPMGAHGGYTFEGDASTEPTPVVVAAAGVGGIDVALEDSGVIAGRLYEGTTAGSGAVVVGAFVPTITGAFLHHRDSPTFSDGMSYLLPIPAGDHWLIRTTVGGKVGFYPRNPPPPPPTNTTPVTVTANSVTEGIDITLANFGGMP